MVAVAQLQLIAIIILALALSYVLYLYWKRQDMIECPSCGARVDLYAEECPHCGHEKDPLVSEMEQEQSVPEADEADDRSETERGDTGAENVQDVNEDRDDAVEEYVCDECGKVFDSEHGLKTHAAQQH